MAELRIRDLAPGEARVVPYPAGKPPKRSVLVVHTPDGVRAYWNVCQHLPIPLEGGSGEVERDEEGRMICSTHGAAYIAATGVCTEGPCFGERLERVAITADGDEWVVTV